MSDGPAVAIVTGASSGIGRATHERLTRQGVVSIGLSRRTADTERTRRCDIRDEADVSRVIGGIAESHGRIDILVNAAGVSSQGDPFGLGLDEWESVLRTNLIGSYFCCKHVMPAMRRRRFGRIVNVSSIAGRSFSRTASLPYTCSKYGVIGLTRQLAAAVGRDGIHVNCVCPSQTRTEMLIDSVPEDRLAALAQPD